jgi:endonuclease/exonuclease/phosphatase family metal-dependent hydrolase
MLINRGYDMKNRNRFKLINAFVPLTIIFGLAAFYGFCFWEQAKGASRDSGLGPRDLASHEPQATSDGSDVELRVMTFNIRYGTANDGDNSWVKRKDTVCDVLRRHKPDVAGLQEALRFQIDYIRAELPQYAEIGVAREDGLVEGEYSCILYRSDRFGVGESGTFWFSDTPEVAGSNTWGNACVRICSWARLIETKTGNAFYAFNLHLDHVSQPSREKSAVLLSERIRKRRYKDPFVVTGDFNVGEGNPVVKYLKGVSAIDVGKGTAGTNPVPMLDTFRVLHPHNADVGTFNGFKGDRGGEKIDYVFVPPGTDVLDAQILYDDLDGRYPSDHFPVMARFRLPGP